MKRWHVTGSGRRAWATGIYYPVAETYTASSADDAITQHEEGWDNGHHGPWLATDTQTNESFIRDGLAGAPGGYEVVSAAEFSERLKKYRER